MAAKLSKELSDALHSQDDLRLEVIDPQSNRVYFIVDADTLSHLEGKSTHDAIERGLESVKRGEGRPLDEVATDIRAEFGFPEPK